jgi:uncharacterized protein
MSSVVKNLAERGLIRPPAYAKDTQYETIMGSYAYGVSSDMSDTDVYAFCIPSKEVIFPHHSGNIIGFDKENIDYETFEQFQQHHIKLHDREYDISIYNIVKYFSLCMDNNPNMIDSLFTPERCILHMTKIGSLVRSNRTIFLHKGSFHRFKGYAFAQLSKAENKNPIGKRKEMVDQFGFDVKYAYHIVRLCDEAEQILTHGTIDLERGKEHMKAVRRGEVPLADIKKWFGEKELELEKLYLNSTVVPMTPDKPRIKALLIQCLEQYYGNMDNLIKEFSSHEIILRDIKKLIENSGV